MKLISSIHKLPLEIFIDCLVDEDYARLIVEGEPTAEEIKEAWNNLLFEYNDAIGGDGQSNFVGFTKQYHHAKLKHDKAVAYIELLNYYYTNEKVIVPKWVNDLNRIVDLRTQFTNENASEFPAYLKKCFSRNKSNLVKMELVKIQLEQLQSVQATKKEVKPDRGYFTRVMINLKNYCNREIPTSISTYEFCVLVNNYTEYVKKMESQKAKK